ncbi:16S rRNA (cytidine(1402)-2'-O)-methyltransferase [Paenibacillus sp. N1-5-1-14]|uniref:16S rRNA (cytidine(1402)-2'-O)-methyltransferase n=1 Tax=Paenibacillus radicibacter TaxID=2972488 RepID=UPI0021592822|nr:16S rRNA (cytidine(1402)-2'-O)-methyltransferase [Paenibacillus radicibacter]MCR8645883.1 16S rRNA (cytidine(1402)-2'-O)-methyltransferase [Paenibacillus radicibacter]
MNIQKSYKDGGACGTLYLVATPIGNLEDMTYRAVRILKEVQIIAAEDTRQTRKLLSHFEISPARLFAYHEHNKQNSGPELVRLLSEGQSIALVSDAGLPAISDPGYDLVCLAVESDIPIVPIPGANAALSGLIASGLPTEKFTFIGFLPREKKGLMKELERLKLLQETLIFYEAPHRVEKTLKAMIEAWGNRRICLARELTKKYEEFVRCTLEEAIAYLEEHAPLGEYCIVVEGYTGDDASGVAGNSQWWASLSIEEHVEHYAQTSGNKKEAIKLAAIDRGVPKREVYNALHE